MSCVLAKWVISETASWALASMPTKVTAAIAKSVGQLTQPWGIQRCQGALDAQKRQDHGPLARHVGKREFLAAIVAQREGSDLLADLPGDGLRVFGDSQRPCG